MVQVDQPVALSPGQAPFASDLVAYLRGVLDVAGDAELLRFPGGRANLTYLLVAEDREYVVRRPPFGELPPSAHDMVREHRAMAGLAPHLWFVPRPVHLCEDPALIGVPFFVMERRRGIVLRDGWPADAGGPATREALSAAVLDMVVALHGLHPRAAGLHRLGRPQGFMARQISGWRQRHHSSKVTDDDTGEAVFSWLAEQSLPEPEPAILHNDLKLDNLMVDAQDRARIVALFDWDMCTVGDALADLGILLAYWAEPDDDPAWYGGTLPPTGAPGFWSRRDLADRYAKATGRDLDAIRPYQVFGLAKIAVLGQQLLTRYEAGDTGDARHAAFRQQVPALWRAADALRSGDAHPLDLG